MVVEQLGPGKMENVFTPIGPIVLVHTSQGKTAKEVKTLTKVLPLRVYACLFFLFVAELSLF